MTWFLVADDQWTKFEVTNTSARAQALWMRAGSYCGQQLTDGRVSRREVKILKGTLAAAEELVAHGYWDRSSTGFVFKDWASSQQTRAKVEARREKWRREKSGTYADIPARTPETPIPLPSPISSVNQAAENDTSVRDTPTRILASRGRQRLRAVDELQLDYDHAGKWEHALSVIAQLPVKEWAAAAAALKSEVDKGNRRLITPQSIVDHWHHWRVGDVPGQRKPLVRAAEAAPQRYREIAAAGGE